MNKSSLLIIACILLLILIAGIVWASLDRNVIDALSEMAADRWGAVTLLDLYSGLGFVAMWIALLERSAARTIPWIVFLFTFGNVATLVYLIRRLIISRSVCEAILGIGEKSVAKE